MGVGGDVVRLFYKLPNRDLTEDYWVNEREGDGEVFSCPLLYWHSCQKLALVHDADMCMCIP